MKRDKSIDIAKGIGICLMIIGHMTGMIPIHKFIYQFHMPMFLIFSGYFFNSQKWTNFLPFAKVRFKQLIIPYIVFTIIILLSIKLIDPSTDITEYILQGPPHAIWFLLSLFLSEIIFFTLYKINNKQIYILICILVLITIGQLLYLNNIDLPYSLSAVPICTAFYAIGYLLKDYLSKLKSTNQIKNICYGIIYLSIIYVYILITNYHTELAGNKIQITGYITALLGTFGIIHLSEFINYKIPYVKSILNWIGRNSIPFIGLNILFIDLLDLHLRPHISDFIIYKCLQILITIITCACISMIANKYFPQIIGKSKKGKTLKP